MTEKGITAKAADSIAFLFTLIILIFAASGLLSELVRWIIEVTTEGFDELPRRDKRMLCTLRFVRLCLTTPKMI